MVYYGWSHTRGAGVRAAPTKGMVAAMVATGGRPVLARVSISDGGERICHPEGEFATTDGCRYHTIRAYVEMPQEPSVATEMALTWGQRAGAVLDWYTTDVRRQRLYRWRPERGAGVPQMEAQ